MGQGRSISNILLFSAALFFLCCTAAQSQTHPKILSLSVIGVEHLHLNNIYCM